MINDTQVYEVAAWRADCYTCGWHRLYESEISAGGFARRHDCKTNPEGARL